MNKTFKLALSAILGAAMVVPAMAQDNFPDVPDNHWAYEALLRLKSNGLLVGYPDGLYRGGRPASRYEMAVAIHATYVNLKNITDGLQKQIDELKSQMGQGNGGDISSLKTALENLQNDVNGMKKWGDDIAALRRLVDTFQKELQDLNVNVEQIKKDLADLTARVEALEKNKPAVTISGDATLFVSAGNGDGGLGGLNKDGRFVGARLNGGNVTETTFARDLSVFHEGALTFTTTKETGPKFSGTIVAGNLIGNNNGVRGSFYNQSQDGAGTGYFDGGASDFYIQNFSVKFDGRAGKTDSNVEIGRVGYKISPYIYMRPDYNTYTDNARWDNGNYTFDGGIVSLGLGPVKLDLFGGRSSNRNSVNGVDISPVAAGSFTADNTLGANAKFGLGDKGSVNVAYLILDSNNGAIYNGQDVNKATVFGADANFALGKINLMGGYSKSDLMKGNNNVVSSDNAAWYAGAGFGIGKLDLSAKYREVDAQFFAPGDWGRLGVWRNPTNLKGLQVDGKIGLGEKLMLKAGFEANKGKSNVLGSPLNSDSETTSFNVGLDFNLSTALTVMLGYEETEFKNVNGGGDSKPKYKWTNIGLGYNLGNDTMIKIGYEFSDIKNEFLLPYLNSAGPSSANGSYKGGYFTTSVSLKF